MQWLQNATQQQIAVYKAKKVAYDAARNAKFRFALAPPDAAPCTSRVPRFACPAYALARTSLCTLSSFAMQPELKAKKAEYDKARYLAKKAAKKATPKDAPKDKVK